MPEHLQGLMDALGSSPAYAITSSWSIVGWNRAYERLYPGVADLAPETGTCCGSSSPIPPSGRLLGRLGRPTAGASSPSSAPRSGRGWPIPRSVDLVTRLQAASPAFREGWASHDVDRFTSTERRFEHPEVGSLVLEHHQLTPADAPGLQLVVYTAAEAGSAARLARAGRLSRLGGSGVVDTPARFRMNRATLLPCSPSRCA